MKLVIKKKSYKACKSKLKVNRILNDKASGLYSFVRSELGLIR
jgi:hypothetical protein